MSWMTCWRIDASSISVALRFLVDTANHTLHLQLPCKFSFLLQNSSELETPYHILPPPSTFLVTLEPHRGMGQTSSVMIGNGFPIRIAIINELPGRKKEESDSVVDRSVASVTSKSPKVTSADPGPTWNLCRMIAFNIAKSYSEGTGNFRPRASSQMRGSWKNDHRTSTLLAIEALISSTTE